MVVPIHATAPIIAPEGASRRAPTLPEGSTGFQPATMHHQPAGSRCYHGAFPQVWTGTE